MGPVSDPGITDFAADGNFPQTKNPPFAMFTRRLFGGCIPDNSALQFGVRMEPGGGQPY
jgi:hypothetical protein